MRTILKPTFWKIAFAFVLLVITSLLWRSYVTSTISDTFPWGFPFQFYLAWGPCRPGEVCSEFNGLYLVLDIIIWYVVSAFIVSMIKKEATLVEKEAAK